MIACKNCHHPFEGRNVNRVPLMLHCGHTFCCSCLYMLSFKITKDVRCPSCKAFTPVHHGKPIEDQLEPNFYLLGLTVAQELKLISTPITNSKLHKTISLHSRKLEKSESVSKCKECLLARVELHCDKCRLSLCSKCFKIVHASANVLRAHTPTPITQANSTPCPLHPGELQRHYCIETAQLMCVLCSLEEEHRGHTIVSLAQAAEDMRAELKPLLAQAEKLYREISRASKVLHDHVPALQTSIRSQVEGLSLATPALFSLLQRRVQVLHKKLVETFDLYAEPAIQAHMLLQKYRVRVHATILRCEALFQDDVLLVQEQAELRKQLSDMNSFPARLQGTSESPRLLQEGPGEVKKLLQEEANEVINCLGKQISEQQRIEPPSLCTSSGTMYKLPATSPAPTPMEDTPRATPPELALPPRFSGSRSKSFSPSYRGQGRHRHLYSSPSPCRGNPSKAMPFYHTPQHRATPTKHASSPRSMPTDNKSPQKTPPPGSSRAPTRVENLEMVYVCYVKDVGEFYVQNCQQDRELKEIQEQLWTHCHNSHAQPNPSLLKQGLICGAFSSKYQEWYRVLLDDVTEDDTPTVTVFYLDYGNTEELLASSLCVLPETLRLHPPMASRCYLHQLHPPSARIPRFTPAPQPNWSYQATDKLKEYTKETTLNMQVFEESRDEFGGRVLAVDLFADNQLSIREKLHMDGLAVLSKPAPPPQPAAVPRPIALEVEQTLEVFLSAAQTPWDFYVLTEENELEAIAAQLKTAFEMHRLPHLHTPTVGAWVTAKSAEFDELFRAKIMDVADAEVKVQYTDYGNEETLPLDRLYVLPEDIASIEIQAIHCHLSDVAPPDGDEDWTHPISDYFHSLLDNAQQVLVTVQEEGQPHKVQVQVRVNGRLEDAATILVRERKARWLLPCTPPDDSQTSSEDPEDPCTPPGDPSTPSTPSRDSGSSVTSPAHVIPCKAPVLSGPRSSSDHHQTAVSSSTLPPPDSQHFSASVTPHLPAKGTPPSSFNSHPSIPPPVLPAVGEWFKCYVTHIDSLQSFHVVRSSSTLVPTRPINGQEVESIEVGGAALAEYEGECYRVVYEGAAEKGEGYIVYYVDSGDRDIVKQLFPLPVELSKIPCKAIPCSLSDTVEQPSILYQHQLQELTAKVQSISTDGRVVVTLDTKRL